jgi:hypothetical protein
MKEPLTLFDKISKAKVSQRDRFILLLILCLSWLVNSFTALLLVKQLPDIVQWVLKALKVL